MSNTLYIRKLSELDHEINILGYEDPFGLWKLSESMKQVLRDNPFIKQSYVPAQVLGVINNKIVGQETVFPLRIRARETYLEAIAGSGLYVHEDYRKTQLGVELIAKREELSKDGIALGCGLSQQALPIHTLFDYLCYPLPRMIGLRKSRSVVEKKLGKTIFSAMVRLIIDVLLLGIATCLKGFIFIKARRLKIVLCDRADKEIEHIITKSGKPFSCEHSVNWINWQLTHRFSTDSQDVQKLYVVRTELGELLGFFMYKIRFHAMASSRGFKNLRLGSLMEWQSADQKKISHTTLILWATLKMQLDGVDAVEICTDENEVIHSLKRFLFLHIGNLSFVIRATVKSPLRYCYGWDQQSNWRLRPAEGDNGLS